MSVVTLMTTSDLPIPLVSGVVLPAQLTEYASDVNRRLLGSRQGMSRLVDIYDIIDLRMLSGLIGELFSTAVAAGDKRLLKNPNIDGYPDLCDLSSERSHGHTVREFLAFPDGGLEVKNTFGAKRPGEWIGLRQTRLGRLQQSLVWKAHHRMTNNLIALRSDYIDGVPQIVSAYFSSELTVDDWTVKLEPTEGSTMTSFCQTRPSAFAKLRKRQLFAHSGYEE